MPGTVPETVLNYVLLISVIYVARFFKMLLEEPLLILLISHKTVEYIFSFLTSAHKHVCHSTELQVKNRTQRLENLRILTKNSYGSVASHFKLA